MKVCRFLMFTILIVLCAACSEEVPDPESFLNDYIHAHETYEYEEIYELINGSNELVLTEDEFTAYASNIHTSIEQQDLSFTYESHELEDDELREMESLTYPVIITMETIAGDLSYESEVTLVKEEGDEGISWLVDWDYEHLFLGLASEKERVKAEIETPDRGEILDRNGNGLAVNGEVASVYVVPERMEDQDQGIQELAGILDLTEERIEELLNQSWVEDHLSVPIKDIPVEDDRESELLDIPGVGITREEGREYPMGEMAAHVTGYTGGITAEELEESEWKGYHENSRIGKSGLEAVWEEELRGEVGARIKILNENDEVKEAVLKKEAEAGETFELSVDTSLQKQLSESLEGETGTGVIMNPATGEVLAMYNTPSYDPNLMSLGVSSEQWEEWQENEDEPFLNRFGQRYSPGSVFKPVTAAIGIEEGTLHPDEVITIEGEHWQEREDWGSYRVTRVNEDIEEVDLRRAMLYSDNIYFAQQALRIGEEAFQDRIEDFAFEETLSFEYPVYSSRLSNDEIDAEALLSDTGYGQGEVLTNPVHLSAVYTAFLHEGSMVEPTLLKRDDGRYWKEDIISPTTAETILNSLIAVVEDSGGTAHDIYEEGISLAGKTGTAELKQSLDDEDGEQLGWFVGFDYEDEDIMVTMMLEQVEGRGGSGYVVPLAKDFFSER